jgi:cysteine synthase
MLNRHSAAAAAAVVAAVAATAVLVTVVIRRTTRSASDVGRRDGGVLDLIGNTPLIRIRSLSDATGCTILGKVEYLNPGGSIKDRAVLRIVEEAERAGQLRPGDTLYEGTVGSTGISLALIARAKGYKCHIVMPDDQAREKYAILRALGAHVEEVRPVSIVDADQFVNLARRRASEDARGFFLNQFENLANARAHYASTAAEIWRQTGGRIDAFVCGAGTGGTIAGVSAFLRERDANIKIVLADPPGSGLWNKVRKGVMYDAAEAEGRRGRHQVDTVTEGVGINRITRNFARAVVDDAVRVSDEESVRMSRHLMQHDALFVGSSSALNCAGAVKLAAQLPKGSVIVTILCDSGTRHLTKFWNDEYLAKKGVL